MKYTLIVEKEDGEMLIYQCNNFDLNKSPQPHYIARGWNNNNKKVVAIRKNLSGDFSHCPVEKNASRIYPSYGPRGKTKTCILSILNHEEGSVIKYKITTIMNTHESTIHTKKIDKI